MPLILAIEPDRRQAAQLSVVVRKRVHAELILVETTERALDAIGNRMPDLVLVPALLSPQDDAALAAALRVIAAAARVQMLTIPVLGTPRPAVSAGGMLSVLRRGKQRAAEPDGCDPAVFAEQIASYLERAAQERPSAVVAEAITHKAVAETAAAEPQPSYESPSLSYESPSLKAAAALEHATVTLDEAVSREWLERVPEAAPEVVEVAPDVDVVEVADAVEPALAAAPDESVSLALEEAVRHLFADSAPAAVDPGPEVGAPAEILPEAAMVAATSVEKDEWVAVEELIAALQLMPLAAIEVTAEDDWIAPVPDEPQRVVEAPEPELVEGPGKSGHEWVALIESLRHDVERLRVERSDKPGGKAAGAAARPDKPDRANKLDKSDKPNRVAKPVQDEWGFFDPQQCGFAALLAKLDEVTDSEDGRTNH